MRWRSELVGEEEKNLVSEFAGRLPLAWPICDCLGTVQSRSTEEIRQILRSTLSDRPEAQNASFNPFVYRRMVSKQTSLRSSHPRGLTRNAFR